MPIRAARPEDTAALVALWERAVRATHHFLTEKDVATIRTELPAVYLPAMEQVWVLVEEEKNGPDNPAEAGPPTARPDGGEKPLGFIGLADDKVEMLFVEPGLRGRHIGTRLLDHVRQGRAALRVDVNEQNPEARGFYRHYGFRETGRSETDSAGRPFPLIHMAL